MTQSSYLWTSGTSIPTLTVSVLRTWDTLSTVSGRVRRRWRLLGSTRISRKRRERHLERPGIAPPKSVARRLALPRAIQVHEHGLSSFSTCGKMVGLLLLPTDRWS